MTTYLLNDIHELATLVMDWHQTVLERLDQMEQQAHSVDMITTIQTIKEYINPLPFIPEYAINQEIVDAD